jgi:hypothetical protein
VKQIIKIILVIYISSILISCVNYNNPLEKPIVIVIAEQASQPIKSTVADLKKDLNQVSASAVKIHTYDNETPLPAASYYFFIGQAHQLVELNPLTSVNNVFENMPQDRGGIIHKLNLRSPAIVLSGIDIQGTQYMVYDYSEQVLGIDKLAYWTGAKPEPIELNKLTSFKSKKVKAPVVPWLVYFENDTDELANLKKPYLEYDWVNFTNMIDSLVRLRYNAIELFDMFGRVEFYTRPEYVKKHPDYQLNENQLARMVDYIHSKGMKIQVNMFFGRKQARLSDEESSCWNLHKQSWLNNWEHYLTNTVIAKADMFTLSPRNQIWDRPYESSCNEDKDEVFNEVFAEFSRLLEQYKPDAPKICICYDDAAEMFNNNFKPSREYLIAWPDDGFGRFKTYPNDNIKNYRVGTYMHAGFWLNHDVADPYPQVIEDSMRAIFDEYDAKHYMMVNGQTFRPFILNLEAFSESARLGKDFDGSAFYYNWASRYFGDQHATDAVSILNSLHQANKHNTGYVEILWQVKKMTAYLSDSPLLHPYKPAVDVDFEGIAGFLEGTQHRIQSLENALTKIDRIKYTIPKNKIFFHDHLTLPVQIFHDLLVFNQQLIDLSQIKNQLDNTKVLTKHQSLRQVAMVLLGKARQQLDLIYQRRLTGDKNPLWATWYDPAKRRPNNGFPVQADLDDIEKAFELNRL